MPGLFGGLFGSGGTPAVAQSATGTGTGGTVYQPSAQPAADVTFQNLVSSFVNPYAAGTTPAQANYPLAETAAVQVGLGGGNPYVNQALAGAQAYGPQAQQLGETAAGYAGGLEGWLP